MPINIPSLQARLLNIARSKKIEYQFLINRLAGEQFLYRLSRSPYAEKLIFKGGSLLFYLLDSDRKTKDLDFSIQQIKTTVPNITKMVESILKIPVEDGFIWKKVEGKILSLPDMDDPGVRITCHFLLGQMRGSVQVDMALGDVVKPVLTPLNRMSYKNEPIFGTSFSILAYPLETVFAEKLCIVLKKGAQNTRMKDFYDLLKLLEHPLDLKKLKTNIENVFTHRKMTITTKIHFEKAEIETLQTTWSHYIKREKTLRAPVQILEIIDKVNKFLKNVLN